MEGGTYFVTLENSNLFVLTFHYFPLLVMIKQHKEWNVSTKHVLDFRLVYYSHEMKRLWSAHYWVFLTENKCRNTCSWVVLNHRCRIRWNQMAFPPCQSLTSTIREWEYIWPWVSCLGASLPTPRCRVKGRPTDLTQPALLCFSLVAFSNNHGLTNLTSDLDVSPKVKFLNSSNLHISKCFKQPGLLSCCVITKHFIF